MEVLEVVQVEIQKSDLNADPHDKPGPWEQGEPGDTHISEILRRVAVESRTWTQDDDADDDVLRMLLGMGFEARAAALYPEMLYQNGFLRHEGVCGQRDGLSLRPPQYGIPDWYWCVEEFKYTGKSLRRKGAQPNAQGVFRAKDLKDIRQEWMWMHQVMGYVNLLNRSTGGMVQCRHGRLHVCWKFGKYERPFKEEYWRYLVEFTEEELEANWAMLQANKGTE